MNRYIIVLITLIIISCLITSAYLAIKQIDGWGWFLFSGVYCLAILTSNKMDQIGEKND